MGPRMAQATQIRARRTAINGEDLNQKMRAWPTEDHTSAASMGLIGEKSKTVCMAIFNQIACQPSFSAAPIRGTRRPPNSIARSTADPSAFAGFGARLKTLAAATRLTGPWLAGTLARPALSSPTLTGPRFGTRRFSGPGFRRPSCVGRTRRWTVTAVAGRGVRRIPTPVWAWLLRAWRTSPHVRRSFTSPLAAACFPVARRFLVPRRFFIPKLLIPRLVTRLRRRALIARDKACAVVHRPRDHLTL